MNKPFTLFEKVLIGLGIIAAIALAVMIND